VWPLVLIGLGVLFLLGNMGVIQDDVWLVLFRIWPLILVAVGLDILFGRRTGIWQGIFLLFILALFAGGGWLVRQSDVVWSGEQHTKTISQRLGGADEADVEIDFGVGELTINALSNTTDLVQGKLDLNENETLSQKFEIVSGTAHLDISSEGTEFYPSWLFDGDKRSQSRVWQIDITDAVPVDLEINTGVGVSEIDLTGMQIGSLNVSAGVGETNVTLPDTGKFETHISGGVGKLVVYVPANIAVKIFVNSGLGNTTVSGNYQRSGSAYVSADYDNAVDKIDLFVSGGIGEVRIIQINE
ncbi:MAG: DUF5668 domain-containing protein, partial [Chloroflexota bacterium]